MTEELFLLRVYGDTAIVFHPPELIAQKHISGPTWRISTFSRQQTAPGSATDSLLIERRFGRTRLHNRVFGYRERFKYLTTVAYTSCSPLVTARAAEVLVI